MTNRVPSDPSVTLSLSMVSPYKQYYAHVSTRTQICFNGAEARNCFKMLLRFQGHLEKLNNKYPASFKEHRGI